jgi:hypothetical protein
VIVEEPLPTEPVTELGADGAPADVTEEDAPLEDEFPIALVATAVNVYATPSVNPVTAQEVAFAAAVHVNPPGLEVIVYPVIADPPLLAGALKLTVVDPDELLEADVMVGAPGTVAGVTDAEVVEESERATPLNAVAVNV